MGSWLYTLPARAVTPSNVSPSCVAQGKDSIRYLQEHVVMPEVYDAIGKFAKGASDLPLQRPRRRLSNSGPLLLATAVQARALTRTCLT